MSARQGQPLWRGQSARNAPYKLDRRQLPRRLNAQTVKQSSREKKFQAATEKGGNEGPLKLPQWRLPKNAVNPDYKARIETNYATVSLQSLNNNQVAYLVYLSSESSVTLRGVMPSAMDSLQIQIRGQRWRAQ